MSIEVQPQLPSELEQAMMMQRACILELREAHSRTCDAFQSYWTLCEKMEAQGVTLDAHSHMLAPQKAAYDVWLRAKNGEPVEDTFDIPEFLKRPL